MRGNVMTWVATTGSISYPIIDPQITKRLEGANTASFQCMANIPVGTVLTIKYNGTNVYRGKVRSIRRRSDNLNTIELMEEASDFKMYRLESAGKGTVTISNPNNTRYLSSYVSTILYGTGWTGQAINDTNVIPGTSTPLPSIRFFNSTVSKALDKMISSICGYKMWFDNEQKIVKFGNTNTDRSGTSVKTVSVRPISSDINYGVDRVIVIGKTEDIYGEAEKAYAGDPPKTLMYQYSECGDSDEAQAIAQQILYDRSVLMERFECDILPGNYVYNEGDVVRINDTYTGVNGVYGIKDINISTEKTTLGLGCSEITIFDLYGDKLTEITGSSFEGTQSSFSGGWQNISSSSAAEWDIDIQNKANVGNFNVTLRLDRFKTPSQLQLADAGLGTENQNFQSTGVSVVVKPSGTMALASETGAYPSEDAERGEAYDIITPQTHYTNAFTYLDDYGPVNIFSFYLNPYPSPPYFGVSSFALATLTVLITDSSGANIPVEYTATVEIGSLYLPTISVKSFGHGDPSGVAWYTLNFTVLIPGGYYLPPGTEIRWYLDGPSYSHVSWVSSSIYRVAKHIHHLQEPWNDVENTYGHSTTITEPNTVDGEGHIHETDEGEGHKTDFINKNHSHDPPTNITVINTYPTSINIYITNSEYINEKIGSTIAGGIATSVSLDITSYLRSGNNKIRITSSTTGSMLFSGSFISYGV